MRSRIPHLILVVQTLAIAVVVLGTAQLAIAGDAECDYELWTRVSPDDPGAIWHYNGGCPARTCEEDTQCHSGQVEWEGLWYSVCDCPEGDAGWCLKAYNRQTYKGRCHLHTCQVNCLVEWDPPLVPGGKYVIWCDCLLPPP